MVARSKTYSGPSGSLQQEGGNDKEFFGAPPMLGRMASGVANVAPSSSTYVGADPDVMELAPEAPFVPTTPQPSPIDTPPVSGTFEPGTRRSNFRICSWAS